METLSLSNIQIHSTKTTRKMNMEPSRKVLIRQSSMASSHFSTDTDSESWESIGKIKKKYTNNKSLADSFGTLNPNLYKDVSNESSTHGSSFGDIHLSHTWIGSDYGQLKIRLLKLKNILEEYHRAGLYFR